MPRQVQIKDDQIGARLAGDLETVIAGVSHQDEKAGLLQIGPRDGTYARFVFDKEDGSHSCEILRVTNVTRWPGDRVTFSHSR
jgi:hypothetical protein